ncbi:hypothetical protein NDA11_003247 [Ustilago hordei]|uniref:Uncharacterized protein n=1 Tax=Ustilago hordei TaxID=120017 RepID=I2G6E3_USTHO|nr:uncharacterized protein UHO2_02129 [Ustilago hordei]KAJ1038962.1 hypothetical protein NDA10_005138 [Ustilago hordei]KAJ1585800.1 hypothetical protein NDA12_001980 [Ustilago hordei]KAJ1588968.1 hypothetical protein NDA15_001028 [Ustilago hordei]KAJ1590840.1 hypothetical protein NDA11_003247 [Ustilago hordei]KAJ1601174.1 hypothetical protein NDA14_007806 [Ustilago hordei]
MALRDAIRYSGDMSRSRVSDHVGLEDDGGVGRPRGKERYGSGRELSSSGEENDSRTKGLEEVEAEDSEGGEEGVVGVMGVGVVGGDEEGLSDEKVVDEDANVRVEVRAEERMPLVTAGDASVRNMVVAV